MDPRSRIDYVKFDDYETVALITREKAMEGECTRIYWNALHTGFIVSYQVTPQTKVGSFLKEFMIANGDVGSAIREACFWAQDWMFGETEDQKVN
jgi:hypothetical protein